MSAYIAVIEGIFICMMLMWEIYWLKKMYQTLNNTSIAMEKMIDSIKKVVTQLEKTSSPLADIMKLFSPANGNGSSVNIGKILPQVKSVSEEKTKN